jgi:hypothetical protein
LPGLAEYHVLEYKNVFTVEKKKKIIKKGNKMTTVKELRKIMYYIAGYLSEDWGCSYSRLVELLRKNIEGLEDLKYGDVYPVLFNVVAANPELSSDIDDLVPIFDCDEAAKELFYGDDSIAKGLE